jgi:hypothetical protein
MHMHINIERHAAQPPVQAHFGSPQKRCDAPPNVRMHTNPPLTNKAMRSHPQSPFGKAWATHFKEANLARLSDEEKRVEYNRFCTEWEEKMGRGSTLRQVHSA